MTVSSASATALYILAVSGISGLCWRADSLHGGCDSSFLRKFNGSLHRGRDCSFLRLCNGSLHLPLPASAMASSAGVSTLYTAGVTALSSAVTAQQE